jgi:phosphatidylserine decarboxylase
MGSLFILLQHLLPKRALSDAVGSLTRIRGGWLTQSAIRLFVRAYQVDLAEADISDVSRFETFNAFFTRALRTGARQQPSEATRVSCPADGSISEQGEIDGNSLLQAKGIHYDLNDLFDGDQTLAARFFGGSYQTIYLAPHNYHRVHAPLAGRPAHLRYVPGALFSVNSATTRKLPRLFCRNERVAVVFEREDGAFALIMVGAMNVGSIELAVPHAAEFTNRPRPSLQPGRSHLLEGPDLARGDEFGRFNMGSTVIFIASRGLLEWDKSLRCGSEVRVGQDIGCVVAP